MAVSKFFRNRKVKDRIRRELLSKTSLNANSYENRIPSSEEMIKAGVIYREFEYDNLDILYVAEGKTRYGRAVAVYKDGRTINCSEAQWVGITQAIANMTGY